MTMAIAALGVNVDKVSPSIFILTPGTKSHWILTLCPNSVIIVLPLRKGDLQSCLSLPFWLPF